MLPGRNPSLQRDPFPLGTSIALNDLSLGTSIAGPRCQLLVRGTLPRYLPVPTDVFLVFERLSLCFGTSLALNRHEIIRRGYYSNKMLTLDLSRSPFIEANTLNSYLCGLEGASEALAGLYIDSGVLRCGLRSSSV